MLVPAYLQPGDTVLLIAPARSVVPSDIQPFIQWVELNEWKLELSPNLFCIKDQFAGDDAERASDLHWALSHPKAKAIFSARGGYGAVRTLEALSHLVGNLDVWLAAQTLKWFVGFSDMTTIHLWLQKNNWASIHGPVATQWGLTHESVQNNIDSLTQTLKGVRQSMSLIHSQVVHLKSFTGQLVGGNLSLIYASLGTPLQPIATNKVLLIEDLDEYLYHIDRMIRSCKNAGLFQDIKALLVGSMIDMKDNAVPFGKSPKEIIMEAVGDMGFPILFDVEIGHDQRNHSVKLGCNITFDCSNLIQEP